MTAVEAKTVLVTVKAYPNPSKKYGETVCCAGIDTVTGEWVRLYPIPYRDLDISQKFKKYTIIKVRCRKALDDHRLESYKVDSDSIELIEHLDTRKDKWKARKDIVLPTVSPSFCRILENAGKNLSLGMFKPEEINFSWAKSTPENQRQKEQCYAQLSFFDRKKKAIENIPFDFYYHFKCADLKNCPGHKLPIADWEIGQAYRDWRRRYRSRDKLLEKIRQRWLSLMCAEKNDFYFFAGNMKRFRSQFMVLGVFYPPK